MTDTAAHKELRLARLVAKLRLAEQASSDLTRERDTLIRELVAECGYGTGARLAKLAGLTRVRIHQIAKR